jgi:hypothetical protein
MPDRRRMLLLGLVCALVFLGGCQFSADIGDSDTTQESSGETARTVVVGIENETDRDVAGPFREAVAWWNERDDEYDTWEAEFVVRPDADDPDIVARFADEVDCENDIACAPKADSYARLLASDRPIRFGLDETANRAELVHGAKHELGHVRGLDHCQAPHWLMGCPDSANHEEKGYVTRENPWRSQTNLSVYVDTDDPAVGDDVRAVLDGYENSSETPEGLKLRQVEDPWLAHIVLTVDSCGNCAYGAGERRMQFKGGQGYDSDGELEFLYWAEFTITAPENGIQRGVRNSLERVLAPDGEPEW